MNTLSVVLLGLGLAIVVGLIFFSYLRRRNPKKSRSINDLAGVLYKEGREPVSIEDISLGEDKC
jgi:hypothetical protein